MAREFAKFFVKDNDEDTREFKTEQQAVETIMADFAESGTNPVLEVWAEDADGNEHRLSVKWTASLEED
jgi:hypothetical protein